VTTVLVNMPKRCGATLAEAVASSPRSLSLIDGETDGFIGNGEQHAFTPAISTWRVEAISGQQGDNGAWLPPGMAPPSSPETPPPSAPVPPPSPSACATADPFGVIASLVGVCRNGGWIPVEGVKGTGTIKLEAFASWTLASDDGRFYSVVSGLDAALRTNGARITFKAILRTDLASTGYPPIEIVSASPQQG
jgi:hypothetical protein